MSGLSIRLEGFPEKVQRIADAIEQLFPGRMAWVHTAPAAVGTSIRIDGLEIPFLAPRKGPDTVPSDS